MGGGQPVNEGFWDDAETHGGFTCQPSPFTSSVTFAKSPNLILGLGFLRGNTGLCTPGGGTPTERGPLSSSLCCWPVHHAEGKDSAFFSLET